MLLVFRLLGVLWIATDECLGSHCSCTQWICVDVCIYVSWCLSVALNASFCVFVYVCVCVCACVCACVCVCVCARARARMFSV